MTWGNPFACAEQTWVEFILTTVFGILCTVASAIVIKHHLQAHYIKKEEKCQ